MTCHPRRNRPLRIAALVRSQFRPAVTAAVAILVTACGGGAETKTGSNGTGLSVPPDDITVSARLTGLGPETLGAITIDTPNAQVIINAAGNRSVNDLRLGMPLELSGSVQGTASTATVNRVNAQSVVSAALLSYEVSSGILNFPGVRLETDANTIYDGVGPSTSLMPGTPLEVFALPKSPLDGSLPWRATRVQAGTRAANEISLLGTVSAINVSSLIVSGVQINTTGVTPSAFGGGSNAVLTSPASIPLNGIVRVTGVIDPATNIINASQLIVGLTPSRPDNSVLVLEGFVQSVSQPGQFRLLDTEVRSTSTEASTIQVGQRVRVRGRKTNGVLDATEVSVAFSNAPIEYTLSGEITGNPRVGSIVVRGETLLISNNTTIAGGGPGDLTPGRRVRLRANAVGGQLVASNVTLL